MSKRQHRSQEQLKQLGMPQKQKKEEKQKDIVTIQVEGMDGFCPAAAENIISTRIKKKKFDEIEVSGNGAVVHIIDLPKKKNEPKRYRVSSAKGKRFEGTKRQAVAETAVRIVQARIA